MPTSPSCMLFLPLAAPFEAQLLAVLVPIPDEQLAARPDGLAGSVKDLPVVLKGHEVLLVLIPGAVHVPGVEAGRKEMAADLFCAPCPTCVRPFT